MDIDSQQPTTHQAPNMDSPEFLATRKLEMWFRTLHPTRMDIVGDFAGRELFILEGDSLLRVAFSDERIDMNGINLPRT